ncbi:MAG: N-acetyl sugar amidotransferase [Rhodospirillaceae bacterium]|jgi:N-acetyl sugar amidotransferase|nr:N-acetyl sugar amidotransferase [Rhodospirillaceae bacterium]
MIKYCTKCLYPETKPDLWFDDDGVCSACQSYNNRPNIDWQAREQEFHDILERYRSKDGSRHDCIVPVSGGKDSTYQTIKLLEHGMNPLCVTSTTCSLTDIGRRNIENLKSLGVDYLEISLNPKIRRRINRIGLKQVGDISWPEHVTIFTVPVRIAVQTKTPLLVWGTNAQNEYGGPAARSDDQVLDRKWLEEFGGLLGMRVSDLAGTEGIERRNLIQYTYPTDEELAAVGVTGVYLGYFYPWDGYVNALYAQAHGFETYPNNVEGSLGDYENLDNYQTGIHDYFKFLKLGFGRATDIANNHIRRGRLSRSEGLTLTRMHDGKFPWIYLGRPIEDILAEIEVSLDEFIQICDRFTNKRIFVCDNQNNLVKDADGNLTKLNDDNVA